MSDIKLTYVLLKLFLFAVFIIYGRILSKTKTNKEFWLHAIVPIIIYAIIEGLRFGRLVDYNVYYFRYINIGKNPSFEDYEPVFTYICYFMYNLGLPYYMFIFLQSLLLITVVFLLVKEYRKALLFILPLILYEIMKSENYVRWYWGFIFMILSFYSLYKGRYKAMLFCFICTCLIHIGFVMFTPVILFYKILKEKTIPPKVATFLFLGTTFLISISSLTFLISITKFLLSMGLGEMGSKVDFYLTSLDLLLKGDLGQLGIKELSFSNSLRLALAYGPTIWFAKDYVKKYRYGVFFYNLFVIGAIISPLFILVEILDRFATTLTFFSCIASGILFTEVIKNRSKYSTYIYLICILSFFAAVWPNISSSYGLDKDIEMLFIWDADGRNYIPYWGGN